MCHDPVQSNCHNTGPQWQLCHGKVTEAYAHTCALSTWPFAVPARSHRMGYEGQGRQAPCYLCRTPRLFRALNLQLASIAL